MITAERNRRPKATVYVQRQIEQHIAWLRAQLEDLDKDLGALIESSPMWRVKDDLLRSVPGVGPVASSVLLAELPELGQLNRREIALWWVLRHITETAAPSEASGRSGVGHVRSALYMATLVATRFNPTIKAFYIRLCESGKEGCPDRLNAKAPYDPQRHHARPDALGPDQKHAACVNLLTLKTVANLLPPGEKGFCRSTLRVVQGLLHGSDGGCAEDWLPACAGTTAIVGPSTGARCSLPRAPGRPTPSGGSGR